MKMINYKTWILLVIFISVVVIALFNLQPKPLIKVTTKQSKSLLINDSHTTIKLNVVKSKSVNVRTTIKDDSVLNITDNDKTTSFNIIKNTKVNKSKFIELLLPKIIQQNKSIILLRKDITDNSISSSKLKKVLKGYKLNKNANIEDILTAVDIIPVSLVLSQAAYESNWGRSRFAKNYNNFFGIWCFKKGCGVVPLKRDDGATHEVAKFSSLAASIKTYMLTINSNRAYKYLRAIRKIARDNNKPISGVELAEGLGNYAQIGREYIEKVKQIITYNKLEQYD